MLDRRFIGILTFLVTVTLALETVPALPQQPPEKEKKDKKDKKDKGFDFAKKGILGDSKKMFDLLAQGGDTISINSTGGLREELAAFAARNGIGGDELTREQFAQFSAELTMQFLAGDGMTDTRIGRLWDQLAEWEFRRKDTNYDGVLDWSEMEGKLRDNLDMWDVNRNGVIELQEFKEFYRFTSSEKFAKDMSKALNPKDKKGKGEPAEVFSEPDRGIDLEELNKLPVVYRAGKLPSGLPDWFAQLDHDHDGQVGLYEWRYSGRPLEEFQAMDRNGDGLLTAEELLFYMAKVAREFATLETQAKMPTYLAPALQVEPLRLSAKK